MMSRDDLTQSVTLAVAAAGLSSERTYPGSDYLFTEAPIDFGLIPSGGVIEVEPALVNFDCQAGTIEVTIRNVGGPDDGPLAIAAINLSHGYSQGDYGRAFTWDLSQITLPAFLASGEQLSFPVTYPGGGSGGPFNSRLHLSVASGARNRETGSGLYRGRAAGCGLGTLTPTPTPTPPPPRVCAGDCNGDGTVGIDDLVLGVLVALQSRPADACPGLRGDAGAVVGIADLVTAVVHALEGCPAG
jgi:hypothetical protein